MIELYCVKRRFKAGFMVIRKEEAYAFELFFDATFLSCNRKSCVVNRSTIDYTLAKHKILEVVVIEDGEYRENIHS